MPDSHLRVVGVRGVQAPPHDNGDAEPGHGYPRPLLRRAHWQSLNGRWRFSIDRDAVWRTPREVPFDDEIVVPFAPETAASGIGDTGLFRACWYQREIPLPELVPHQRLILHFGAVDYFATVWVDDTVAVTHEGGYAPFSADITELVRGKRSVKITVYAYDDPSDLSKPRGKQDWQLRPHSIWYPRTTGIWQTVWYEVVHESSIAALRWTPYLDRWELGLSLQLSPLCSREVSINLRLYCRGVVLARDRYSAAAGEVHRRITLSDPGIDDFRNEFLWSPARPTLIEAEIDVIDEQRQRVDSVRSYTALRSFSADRDRLVLNGRPYPLRMVLDQGYWPETGLTAPDDAALKRDVELTKAMGFNGARKHQKIEDPRYLYWADRLGLLVWEEMPSAYRFTTLSVERLTRQWLEVLRRDISHPCIIAWVPFNESWGVPNLPDSAPERNYVQSLYFLTKTIDPTRPVVGNDGWESVATDIIGIHDYDRRPTRIAARYDAQSELPTLLKRERPGGRVLSLAGPGTEHPVVLSEFGGIALANENEAWGYSQARNPQDLRARYESLLKTVTSLRMLSGFCYTQFADTYQEANGLLYADRSPKVPLEVIAAANLADRHEEAPGADVPKTERSEAPA
jgi:beta-galactosidase/beta-glucuronidase